MPEPVTIEEMVNFVIAMEENLASSAPQDSRLYASRAILQAIRAILEQQRDSPSGWIPAALMETEKREAIRAFVERVIDRWKNCKSDNLMSTSPWHDALMEELAAMQGRDEE